MGRGGNGEADSIITLSNVGFDIFTGFRSTRGGGVKISVFPLTLLVIVRLQ